MTRHRLHAAGFTFGELLVAIGILILLIGILLPAIGNARRTTRGMQNNSQVRGIHQSLVMYAQGNEGFFPGLDSAGEAVKPRVEERLEILLRGNYFTGEYLVSPEETRPVWTSGPVMFAHYSYAMLDIHPERGSRYGEWRETLNTEAVAVSDRNAGADSGANVSSIHTRGTGVWRGQLVWNDNHVTFEESHLVPTRFGQEGDENKADNLFEAAGDGDALLIHSGR